MAKYRKLPIEVEAIVWDGSNQAEIDEFMGLAEDPSDSTHAFDASGNGRLYIKTLDSTAIALPGDYVIKGSAGEFYPCKADIFGSTYELVQLTITVPVVS